MLPIVCGFNPASTTDTLENGETGDSFWGLSGEQTVESARYLSENANWTKG